MWVLPDLLVDFFEAFVGGGEFGVGVGGAVHDEFELADGGLE